MPWRKLYESCVSETNPNKLRKLVFELEDAIVLRYHDLGCEPNRLNGLKESDELQAIRRAAERLLQLKIDKLGWPNPATAVASAVPAAILASLPAVMPLSIAASMPISTDDVKQSITPRTTWRTVVSRTQAALLVVERAWQNWVFKSLK